MIRLCGQHFSLFGKGHNCNPKDYHPCV